MGGIKLKESSENIPSLPSHFLASEVWLNGICVCYIPLIVCLQDQAYGRDERMPTECRD